MARFRLTAGHYLNVPGTEWEQVEVDQKTGKQGRHRYKVHKFLHPEDPGCWNYIHQPSVMGQGGSGEVIVATEPDPNYPRDIIFIGPPTTDMEPLDKAAEALIRNLPKGLPPMGDAAFPTVGPPAGVVADQNQLAQFMAQMQGQMALLVGQNEALQRQLDELREEKLDAEPLHEPAPAEVRL